MRIKMTGAMLVVSVSPGLSYFSTIVSLPTLISSHLAFSISSPASDIGLNREIMRL